MNHLVWKTILHEIWLTVIYVLHIIFIEISTVKNFIKHVIRKAIF